MSQVITGVPTASPKNETITASLKATKARRTQQRCRVFEVKLDSSHLNQHTREHLKFVFLEAKWLYNHILSLPTVFDIDYKLDAVPVKVKDTFELRELVQLSSHMKQSLIRRTIDNIKGLARLKTNGHKIGRLKYKSCVKSIPLKQYGNTYRILNDKYLKLQGISQQLRVNGLAQIPAGSELANATLIQWHGDYFVAITTYQTKTHTTPPVKTVGIDFGIKTQLTLSDGIAIQYAIPISTTLRKLHQKLSRCQFRSQNWYITLRKLENAYVKVNNIKQDVKNKLVHYLHTTYGVVCYQDEHVKAWQRLWGSKILSIAIGGLIRTLETKVHTPIQVDRWFPSTKTCSRCGNIRGIGLDERVYVCPVCGLVIDRDHNSSVNLEHEGLTQLVPTGRRDGKPVETEASTFALGYLNRIPYVTASSVGEAGSLTASA